MAPGTEFARDFCAGIGLLQLGVVLVSFLITYEAVIGIGDLGTCKKKSDSLGSFLVFCNTS